MNDFQRKFHFISVILIITYCSGCRARPKQFHTNYKIPETWINDTPDNSTGSDNLLEIWWSLFDDPILSDIIANATSGNLSLQDAYLRIAESKLRRRLTTGEFAPDIDFAGSYARLRNSANTVPFGTKIEDFNRYSSGIESNWELDLFGRIRQSLKATTAEWEASQDDYRDILVILCSEIALNYIEMRLSQSRLAIAEDNIEAQQQSLNLAIDRVKAGVSPALDVAQARSNLADTESAVPILRVSLQESMNRICVLLGKMPGEFDELFANPAQITLPIKKFEAPIPVAVIEGRPDVRRLKKLVEAQTARMSSVRSELYPRLVFTGFFSFDASQFRETGNHQSRTYSYGPSFRWNLFDGERTRNRIRIENSILGQSLIRYENSILLAIEEVENAMVAYNQEKIRRDALSRAVKASIDSVKLAQQLYKGGQTQFQNVLDAQRSLLAFQDRLAVSQSGVISKLILLYKSLGGNWDLADNKFER